MLEEQKQQTKTLQDLLQAKGVGSPLIEALSDINTELAGIKGSIAPEVSCNPNAEILVGWMAGRPTDVKSITFAKESTHYDYTKTVWKSQSGVKLFGFFSIGHHTETHSKETVVSSSSSYKLEMSFAATTPINIRQGAWFNGALLRNYKDGPWVEGSQFKKGLSHPYGQGGILALLPTSVFVAMNPTIKITLDQQTYQSLKTQMNSSGGSGLNIGPFAFGGSASSGSSAHTHIDTNDQSSTMTCTDTSNIPQIITVVNQVMP